MNTLVPTATSEGRKARTGLQSAGSSSLPGTDGWADVKTEIAGLDGLSETGATRITQNPEDPAHGREHGTGPLSGEELSLKKWWLPQAPFLPGPCHSSSFPSEWEAGAVPPPGAAEGKGKCPGRKERPEQWHTHCELSESPESGTLSLTLCLALEGAGGESGACIRDLLPQLRTEVVLADSLLPRCSEHQAHTRGIIPRAHEPLWSPRRDPQGVERM